MRVFLLVACFALIAMAFPVRAVPPLDSRLQPLAWLAGEWTRTDLPPGQVGFERWQVEEGALVGAGVTRQGAQTLFQEGLRIQADHDGVFYVVDVAHNAGPVRFQMTEHGAGSVVFENPAHDFPKKIAYRRTGEGMDVEVSGAGRVSLFKFVRKAPAD
ncbi:MAG TPA: DUF6265 family protein [Stenotrophomonas sp.]|jgi:hypothetical protein